MHAGAASILEESLGCCRWRICGSRISERAIWRSRATSTSGNYLRPCGGILLRARKSLCGLGASHGLVNAPCLRYAPQQSGPSPSWHWARLDSRRTRSHLSAWQLPCTSSHSASQIPQISELCHCRWRLSFQGFTRSRGSFDLARTSDFADGPQSSIRT